MTDELTTEPPHLPDRIAHDLLAEETLRVMRQTYLEMVALRIAIGTLTERVAALALELQRDRLGH
jgi:hypothetical protein